MQLFQPGPVVWIQNMLASPAWTEVAWALSLLGTTWGIVLVAGLALWLGGRRTLYGLLVVLTIETAVKTALAKIVTVARPEPGGAITVRDAVPGVSSFPSGHVSTTAATWGWLAFRGFVPLAAAFAAGFGVALARLQLGAHWVADVVAALLLGFGFAWGVSRGWSWIEARLRRVPFGGWVAVAAVVLAAAVGALWMGPGDTLGRWRGAGFVAAAAVALPLEHRFVRYRPAEVGAWRRVLRVAIGLLLLVPLAFADRFSGHASPGLAATLVAAGTLWALLFAPALFGRMEVGAWDSDEWVPGGKGMLRVGGVGAVLVVLLTAYGSLVEPRFLGEVREEVGPVPGLPAGWEGREVALLADLQVGMWGGNEGMVEALVDRIVERRPALVLLAGDFVYAPGADAGDEEAGRAAELIRPLTDAGLPVFAVLGNHDWALDAPDGEPREEVARTVRRRLEEVGVRVLDNEAAPVAGQGGGLTVVGVGSEWAGRSRPAEAVAGVEGPRIVFMHNPDSYEGLPDGSAPLAFAAHTHGGQVRLPGTPSWSWLSFMRDNEVHADGWIERDAGETRNRLYVNRGVGFSALPLRINARPELTIFRLQSPRR